MNDQIDASIPVLTEIINPDQDVNGAEKVAPVANTAPQKPMAMSPVGAPTSSKGIDLASFKIPTAPQALVQHGDQHTSFKAEINQQELLQLENRVKEAVLNQVLTRIDFALDHRIRDSLADVLQLAIDNLAADLRLGLRQSLEEVITRAVTQEISKLKSGRQ